MYIKNNHLSGDQRAWVSYHDARTVEKTVGDGGKFGLMSNMPARFRNFAIITATNVEVFYFIFCFLFVFCFLFLFIFSIFSSGCISPFAQLRKELLQGYPLFLELNQGRFYFFFFFFFFFHPPLTSPPPKRSTTSRSNVANSSLSWRPRLHLPRPHLHHHPCDSFGLPSEYLLTTGRAGVAFDTTAGFSSTTGGTPFSGEITTIEGAPTTIEVTGGGGGGGLSGGEIAGIVVGSVFGAVLLAAAAAAAAAVMKKRGEGEDSYGSGGESNKGVPVMDIESHQRRVVEGEMASVTERTK